MRQASERFRLASLTTLGVYLQYAECMGFLCCAPIGFNLGAWLQPRLEHEARRK